MCMTHAYATVQATLWWYCFSIQKYRLLIQVDGILVIIMWYLDAWYLSLNVSVFNLWIWPCSLVVCHLLCS